MKTIALHEFPEAISGLILMLFLIVALGLIGWRMIQKAFYYGDRGINTPRGVAVLILCACVTLIIGAAVLAVRFATMG